jgi:hypothetical protein
MADTGVLWIEWDSRYERLADVSELPADGSDSYSFVTGPAASDEPSQGSYRRTCATPAHQFHFAARVGGHMPSSTPDWSALVSQNERLVDERADEGPSGSDLVVQHPAGQRQPGQRQPGQAGRHRAAAGSAHQPRWRNRASRSAAAATAAVLVVGGAGTVSASAATAVVPSWQIVKQVHAGAGGFTAVTAAGATGGWAFNGQSKPTAWRRNGASWTKVSFPGKSGESVVAASASSATNVWAFTGGGSRSRALRWNGSTWTVERSFAKQIGGAMVLSRDDVWVFGEPDVPGSGLGSWHFNGHTWTHVTSGKGLEGGSGVSASNVWAFEGTDVAHWNGHTWSRTSVNALLPARNPKGTNDPAVVGILAPSPNSAWAIGSGNAQDEGGPTVVLHYNGHAWSKVAQGNFGLGTNPLQQVSSDGHGGLWIPMPASGGRASFLVHYSGGHLSEAALPANNRKINVTAVALIPHTTHMLGGGFTHAFNNPGAKVVAVILEYRS